MIRLALARRLSIVASAACLVIVAGCAGTRSDATQPEPATGAAPAPTEASSGARVSIVDATSGESLAADAVVFAQRVDANRRERTRHESALDLQLAPGAWFLWVEHPSGSHLGALHHVVVDADEREIVLRSWRARDVVVEFQARAYTVSHLNRLERNEIVTDLSGTAIDERATSARASFADELARDGVRVLDRHPLQVAPGNQGALELAAFIGVDDCICAQQLTPVELLPNGARFVVPEGTQPVLCERVFRNHLRDQQALQAAFDRRAASHGELVPLLALAELPVENGRHLFDRTAVVTGRVVERDGVTPIANASVQLFAPWYGKELTFNPTRLGHQLTLATDADGRFSAVVLGGPHEVRAFRSHMDRPSSGRFLERARFDVPFDGSNIDVGTLVSTLLDQEVDLKLVFDETLDAEDFEFALAGLEPANELVAERRRFPWNGLTGLGQLAPGTYRITIARSSRNSGVRLAIDGHPDGLVFRHPEDTASWIVVNCVAVE